jgi:hypothetical protein
MESVFISDGLFFYRFMSVTDRFLAELGPVAMGQVSKDASPRYENLVKGLKHIKIKVASFFDTSTSFLPLHQGLAARSLRRRRGVYGISVKILR